MESTLNTQATANITNWIAAPSGLGESASFEIYRAYKNGTRCMGTLGRQGMKAVAAKEREGQTFRAGFVSGKRTLTEAGFTSLDEAKRWLEANLFGFAMAEPEISNLFPWELCCATGGMVKSR